MKKTTLWFSVLFLGAARLGAWNSAPPATASVGATSATVSASTTAPSGFVPRVVMLWVKDPPASGGAWHVLNTAAGANGSFLTVSATYTFSHGPGPYVWQVNYADGGAPPAPPGGTLLAGSGPTTTNVSQPNVAPTVSAWPALPTNPLYVGTNFTAQATGSDTDGNLYSIFVDLSTNGGAWTPFAYNGAAPPNGNGFSSTSDGNVWTAGPVGTTYQFRAQATDQLQVSSPWQATAVYTVANRPPTVSWSVTPPTPLLSGTNFTAQASGTDPDANLGVINVDLSINGGAWTAFAYNDATKNGTRSSTISDGNVLTAGPAGTTYQFRAQTIDLSGASSAWLSTAVYTVTQANVAPSITTQPVSATVNQGQTASFTVVAAGTPAPTYQWRKGGGNISGATSATLTITNAQPADAGSYDVVVTNSSGTVTSNTVTLTVNVPPAITTQPVSAAVNQGQTATFTVVATGTPAPTYQWRKSGVNISGATSATLTIPNAQSGNAGSYDVVVSNSAGSVTSNAVTLTINAPPSITTQPVNATVTQGQTATFTVVATGTPAPTYQWRKNGVNIVGATSAALTIGNAQPGDAANYDVVVTNSLGSVMSVAVTLTVNVPPSITLQPIAQTVTAGQPVTFTVAATGTAPLTYQWKKNAVNIAGATGTGFTIASAAAADAATYTVTVSNVAGSVTSNGAGLTVNIPPVITTQPASQTVTAGQSVTFTVAATGTAPLSYQWKIGGVNIAGATSTSYTIAATVAGDAASYTVTVSNVAGSVTSNGAVLTVNTPVAPAITTQPVSQTVTSGQSVSFSVGVSGTAPLTYQWRKGGVSIGGATTATLTINNAQAGDAANYDVVVSNSAGSVTSNSVTLTVTITAAPPVITTQPVSVTVNQGQPASFTVVATGTPAPAYQWRKNGVNIIGATSAALTISNAQLDASGSYSVVVSNSAGTVTSNVVTLTVNPIARAITISAPATVNAGQTISIPTSAVTNVGGGEVIGHYHIEYSVNGGGSWTAFAFDAWDPPATGPTSVTRTPTITAGAYGSVIKVRVRVSFRRGAAGDVDYTGSPMDWGKWTNWDTPPTVYASIPVSSEPAQPLFTATAATGTYVLDATVQKLGASATSFGDGVIVEVFKRSPGVPDFVLWSSLLARPNAGHLARVNLKASLAAGESLSYRRIAHTADTTDDLITFTGAVKVANIVQVRNDIAFTTNPTAGKTALLRGLIDTAQNSFTAGVDRVEILVPAGDYYLDDVAYGGENLANNDKNLLSISHDNITLRGAGTGPGNNTRLIAKGTNRILVDVNGASNVNLENLIFDFEQPALTFVQGNVTGMNPGTKTITADLDWLPGDTTPFNSTYVDGNGPHYPDLLVHGYSAAGLFLNYGAFGTDTAHLPTFGTNPATGRPTVTVTFTFDPATVFTTPIPVAPAQQDRMVLRYSGSPFPGQSVESALRFNGTTDCEVNNVTLRASQNLAMICRGTNGMHFNLYTIERAPTISGTPVNRQISTIKDAIHYQGGVRGPTVESCRFDGLGDDALNIYASPIGVAISNGSSSFPSSKGTFAIGDVLMVYVYVPAHKDSNNNDIPVAIATQANVLVTNVNPLNANTDTITVDTALTPTANPDGLIYPYNQIFKMSQSGEGFLIRYNEFGAFRGFGVREQTGFGLISANLFTGTSGSPISLENSPAFEGPFPWYVKIQGNIFSGSGYGLYGGLAIRHGLGVNPWPSPWFTNIVVPTVATDPEQNLVASPMTLKYF